MHNLHNRSARVEVMCVYLAVHEAARQNFLHIVRGLGLLRGLLLRRRLSRFVCHYAIGVHCVEGKQMGVFGGGGLGLQLRRSLLRECKTEQDEKKERRSRYGFFLLLLVERMGGEFAAAKGTRRLSVRLSLSVVQVQWVRSMVVVHIRMDQPNTSQIDHNFTYTYFLYHRIKSPYSSQIKREINNPYKCY